MKPPATRHHDRTGTAYLQTKADAIRRRVYERGLHFPEGYPLEVLAALADLRLSDEANSADVEEILCGCGTGRKAYDIGDFTEQAQSAEESSDSQNDTGDIDEGVGTQIVVEGSAIPVAQCTTRGTSSPIFAAKDAEHGTIKKIPADAYNFPIFAGDDVRLIRFEEGERVLVYTERINGRPEWRRATIAPFLQYPPSMELTWHVPGLIFYRYMVIMANDEQVAGPFRTALKEIRPASER